MLHEELKKIYETYCLDESVDKIRFDPFIVEEIRNSRWQGSVRRRPTSAALRPRSSPVLVWPPSRRGAVHGGGEAADHEVFVRGLRARPVPAGERFHPHVLSQR